jgi:hypothetical protein
LLDHRNRVDSEGLSNHLVELQREGKEIVSTFLRQ